MSAFEPGSMRPKGMDDKQYSQWLKERDERLAKEYAEAPTRAVRQGWIGSGLEQRRKTETLP